MGVLEIPMQIMGQRLTVGGVHGVATRFMMYQTDPPRSPKDVLPTMYDLPSEDPEEPGLPDQFHLLQPRLLDETFRPPKLKKKDNELNG